MQLLSDGVSRSVPSTSYTIIGVLTFILKVIGSELIRLIPSMSMFIVRMMRCKVIFCTLPRPDERGKRYAQDSVSDSTLADRELIIFASTFGPNMRDHLVDTDLLCRAHPA